MDGHIRIDGTRITVESIKLKSTILLFEGTGQWTDMPRFPELLQGRKHWLRGDILLAGDLQAEDLGWLAEQTPALRRVSGRLHAKWNVEGPLVKPAVNATVRLTDGELRPDRDLPPLRSLNLEAAVTAESLQLRTATGEIGGALFRFSGAARRNPNNSIETDLRFQGENLLFYRSEGVKLRADTDLTVKGPLSRLELAGEVAFTDGHFKKYFDFLGALKGPERPKSDTRLQPFSLREPPFRDAVFDVRLTSKQPFKIRNNVAKGSVRTDLRLSGTGEVPVLTGKLYVDATRLILPAGSLVFPSGVIRFEPNRPDRPVLDLIGESRILGYDVTVVVEGPYDEPIITLSSVPPLSDEELLMLILTGQIPNTRDDRKGAQRQNINVAVYVGRDLISRWFGSESTDSLDSIFERFEVEVGRAVTRSGDETVDAKFRVTEGLLRDGDTLYLAGEKDVFDFYNAGVRIVFRFK
jgi:translocation and assembly module TamB